jgi:hypothetical protein
MVRGNSKDKCAKKKGVFFTMISILLLSVLMLSFSFYNEYGLRTKSLLVETRVSTMDDFIGDLDKDLQRSLYISSHRSILSMIRHITDTGKFSKDVNSDFYTLIMNGTLNGTAQSLMENTTMTYWMTKMQLQSDAINIIVDFEVENITIYMADPWNVGVTLKITEFVQDLLGTASWNMSRQVDTTVSIIGFEDPIYSLKTSGKVLNTINKTTYTHFVTGIDTSNLNSHNSYSYYLAWEMAPDFLMRLSGNLSSSPNGIESMVNLDELQTAGLAIQQRSVIDYIYWGGQVVNSYQVNNTPSWFWIDDQQNPYQNNTDHLRLYEVNGTTI